MISVTVQTVEPEHAAVTFPIGNRKRLGVHVSLKAKEGESARNICRINVTVDKRGPRGGYRGPGVSIGYVEFDVRDKIPYPFGGDDGV